jgi:hypothetical protein
MTRYYPPPDLSVLLLPAGLALMVSTPALRKPFGLLLFGMLGIATFLSTFAIWRYHLRVEVDEDVIRGRNPETFKWTELRLAEITNATPSAYGIGQIPGWSFESAGGKAVFVNKAGPADVRIRNIIEARTKPKP